MTERIDLTPSEAELLYLALAWMESETQGREEEINELSIRLLNVMEKLKQRIERNGYK